MELNRAKIVARLEAEGWVSVGGGEHEKFVREGSNVAAVVPRHRTLSPGVARSIAKAAAW